LNLWDQASLFRFLYKKKRLKSRLSGKTKHANTLLLDSKPGIIDTGFDNKEQPPLII